MVFIHALRYASTAPEARDKSICLRHDSKYAALVSCGVYKEKKNKALVAIARDEWKLIEEGVQQGTLQKMSISPCEYLDNEIRILQAVKWEINDRVAFENHIKNIEKLLANQTNY